jgi:hypothetical protein
VKRPFSKFHAQRKSLLILALLGGCVFSANANPCGLTAHNNSVPNSTLFDNVNLTPHKIVKFKPQTPLREIIRLTAK